MTLNGYFALNSVFAPFCLASYHATFENNCVKTDKDRHVLNYHRRKSSAGVLVSGDIRFVGYSRGFSEKARGVKGQWGRALTLV